MRITSPSLLAYLLVLWLAMTSSWAQAPYSDSQLDTLVGPIALYPDVVLSNVVKASTFPDQVIAASKSSKIDSNWDASVAALDDYPQVLTLMTTNQEWMKSLGWAAANQLPGLMDAVQRYRFRAQNAGNLTSNSKLTVIQEGTTIRIEPTNPQVIYVPTYDANTADDHALGTAIVYGAAIATSAYLWSNIYHWNTNSFYVHPYGWYPPAAYYRPYGWQNGGVFVAGNTVRLSGNNVYRGGVTVNNINRNTVNVNNVTRNNVSRNDVNRNNVNINNTNRNNVTRNDVNRNNMGRPPVATPRINNRVTAAPAASVTRTRTTSSAGRPAVSGGNFGGGSPGLGSYSSAGATTRESNRGAYSRQTTSFSSGARMGGRAGGGRRR